PGGGARACGAVLRRFPQAVLSHCKFCPGDRQVPGRPANPGRARAGPTRLPAARASERSHAMSTAPATVGVIGLGNMGLPMAGHLLAAGFALRGYDVRPEAVDAPAPAGGAPAAGPAAAGAGAGVAVPPPPPGGAPRGGGGAGA